MKLPIKIIFHLQQCSALAVLGEVWHPATARAGHGFLISDFEMWPYLKFLIWGQPAFIFGCYLNSPVLLTFLFWTDCCPSWCLHPQLWFTITCILLFLACAFSTHKCWNSFILHDLFLLLLLRKVVHSLSESFKITLSRSQWMKVCFQGLIPVSCVMGVKCIWGYKKEKFGIRKGIGS